MEDQLRLSVVHAAEPMDDRAGPVGAPPSVTPLPTTLDQFGDVLTVEEAARVLRISRASAYELTRRWRSDNPSGLPVIQLGRFLRVPKSALEQILAQPAELHASLIPSEELD